MSTIILKMIKNMYSDVAIIIPARIGSQRLSRKPLQLIGEHPMIEHVLTSVMQTGIEHVYVATDSEEIAAAVSRLGGKPLLTSANYSSGTDRVHAAFQLIPHNEEINYIINVQGDMPFIDPAVILDIAEALQQGNFSIVTPVVKVGKAIASSPSNVKVVVDLSGRALYFSRSLIPYGSEDFLYHIGIYGFTKAALNNFVKLPQTKLEIHEKLEQLRALENGIAIGICYANTAPISVDTKEDLEKAINFYQQRKK